MNKMNLSSDEKKITRTLFLRSFMLEASFNFEKMQALGFAWAMFPVIRKYYTTKEEQVEALKRHTAFFNIIPYIYHHFCWGCLHPWKRNMQRNAVSIHP